MTKQTQRSTLILLFLTSSILLLAACTAQASNHPTSTATPARTPTPAETNTPHPTNIPEPSPTPALPPVPIVYYYFVAVESGTYPAGSVEILPDALILGPTLSDIARSPDTVTNIGSALRAMLNDPRNAWTSKNVGITRITFKEGAARVVLEGEYFGAGDVVLMAARDQILLTVFSDEAVQTATITLNGENIANLGISRSSQAQPDDSAYTRAEIETFLAENAYTPAAAPGRQDNSQPFSLLGIWQQNRSMAAGWADRYHFYPSGAFHFYPNEMICRKEKVEKIGTWTYEAPILTLTSIQQVILSLEIYPSGLCKVIGKEEVKLTNPTIEQFTIAERGTQEGDAYPSISIQGVPFWKFSEDASSYGEEKFPE